MTEDHDIAIHPAAECVRLMDADELASLAASIEANGQRDKIVLGRINGASVVQLVDGRNRLRACDMVGVEPQFETLDFATDEEVKAFIADKSEHRNLTKGQQAMRLALLYPDREAGGRGRKSTATKVVETTGFSKSRLDQARAVLAHSRDLAIAVRDGVESLDKALEKVKAAREALTSQELMIERLRNGAPDLADLVAEERMKLSEAIAALDERTRAAEREEESKRSTIRRTTFDAYRGVVAWASDEFVEEVTSRIADENFRAALLGELRPTNDEIGRIKTGAVNLSRSPQNTNREEKRMSAPIVSSLSELLAVEKKLYLVDREQHGGTAEGFRKRIGDLYAVERGVITDRLAINLASVRLDGLNDDQKRAAIEAAVRDAHGPTKFAALQFQSLMEATNKNWQRQPRKRGPDLFSIGGLTIPEYLTRRIFDKPIDGDAIEEDVDETFEKVDHDFATVRDLTDDALIKMRKAAQSSTAAEIEMKAADEARRRAKGNDAMLIRLVADKARKG